MFLKGQIGIPGDKGERGLPGLPVSAMSFILNFLKRIYSYIIFSILDLYRRAYKTLYHNIAVTINTETFKHFLFMQTLLDFKTFFFVANHSSIWYLMLFFSFICQGVQGPQGNAGSPGSPGLPVSR